jgi:serine protease Do
MMRACLKRLLLAVVVLALTAPAAHAQSVHDTIQSVQQRVVKIFGAGGIRGLYSYSTGFLVSPEGHVATVWSHVLDNDGFRVVLHDGRQFQGKVVNAEPQLDLAVIKLEADAGEDFPYFDLDVTGTAGPGARVLGFSNMFKVATGDEPVSVLHGVIAARTELAARRGSFETPYNGPVYVVDAITNNPGAGGGVLTTRDGTLLGMIGKELRNAKSNTWINYTIPIGELKEVIEQIISGDYSTRERESLADNPNRYRPLDFGLVLLPDVLYRTPAYVDSVLPGSPAAQAGIRPDDLIMFVNDELIQSHRVLQGELGRLEAGDTLRLMVRRGNQLIAAELPVERKSDE